MSENVQEPTTEVTDEVTVDVAEISKPKTRVKKKAKQVEVEETEPDVTVEVEVETAVVQVEVETVDSVINKYTDNKRDAQIALTALLRGKTVFVKHATGKVHVLGYPFYKNGEDFVKRRYGSDVTILNKLERQK